MTRDLKACLASTLAYVAVKRAYGTPPVDAYNGYVIDRNGDVYSLTRAFMHGAICAALYPEVLENYLPEDVEDGHIKGGWSLDDVPVFALQRFELRMRDSLPVIRIAISAMSGGVSVEFPAGPCTRKQTESLKKVLYDAMGLDKSDTVTSDFFEISAEACVRLSSLNNDGRMTARHTNRSEEEGHW